MRLIVRSAGREIDIRIAQDDTDVLAAAERTALRLLGLLPDEPEQESEEAPPFGFSVSTDTERAEPELPYHDEEDED
ncbi:hypothetical protein [Streptomyces sp. AC1-42T]|uniref:hypothetical protein n=1 Tax=Streptomyces sp. AC1-42T TaxID=2218665 RepID=UPI000DAED340|nr:hypothetical protein [Streptomyces sp. AC1-42T]PZT71508.1 hypothetical protein DNK55_32880 [Streptomyces sp. AC1-42T]